MLEPTFMTRSPSGFFAATMSCGETLGRGNEAARIHNDSRAVPRRRGRSPRAQQSTLPVIGFLSARSPAEAASVLNAFRQGLGETGYFEGKNVTIEYRWADGKYDRLPALAAELVSRQVTVIAATGGEPSPLAATAATTTIPIIFTAGGDPVAAGLVASLNRPGGNLTGTTIMGLQMGSKRLELIRELLPKATAMAMLINPNFPTSPAETRDVQDAARALRLQINVLNASTESQIDAAFSTIVQQRIDALIVATEPFLLGQRDQLVRPAARHAVPTMYFLRELVEVGGLMSYGPNIANGIDRRAFTPAGFSKVRRLPSCRSCNRQSSV